MLTYTFLAPREAMLLPGTYIRFSPKEIPSMCKIIATGCHRHTIYNLTYIV